MDQKIIDYLIAKGVNEDLIARIMSSEEDKETMARYITEYEIALSQSGFTVYDAFEGFKTFQRKSNCISEKQRLLEDGEKIRIGY